MLQTVSQARGGGDLVFKRENLDFIENVPWGDVGEVPGLCIFAFPDIPTVSSPSVRSQNVYPPDLRAARCEPAASLQPAQPVAGLFQRGADGPPAPCTQQCRLPWGCARLSAGHWVAACAAKQPAFT